MSSSERSGCQPIAAWIFVGRRDAVEHVLDPVLVDLLVGDVDRSSDDEPVSSITRSASAVIEIRFVEPTL